VIDSTPVLPVSDSVILSKEVDGVVIVVDSGTSKRLVRDTCSRLFYVRAKMLGVVLNNVNPEQERYYASRYLYRQVS
jgi:polysaccharide biosynthesis transport protein